MAKVFAGIDDELAAWIGRQQMFFVATAPLAGDGLINCSPKGGDSFRILGGNEVAYQDFTGSGVETIAHLRENGRIVIMFCAFEGAPKILRLHGRGTVLTPGDPGFDTLAGRFRPNPGTRAIIRVAVQRIADSCGYAVPLYEFRAPRDILDRWSEEKGEEGVRAYQRANNRRSLDGLPGLDFP
ncbi:MAG: pyridoxamine 5'-phosphate oxidase family protein [Pseudomonadota bacterium]